MSWNLYLSNSAIILLKVFTSEEYIDNFILEKLRFRKNDNRFKLWRFFSWCVSTNINILHWSFEN